MAGNLNLGDSKETNTMKQNLNVWRMYDKGEVDKLVARLEKKIEKKDKEIADLKAKLRNL
mgnify:CR=1 FL=1